MIVHLILNSHLDPVWLWRRSQGVDEVLATARTACDLLDAYPEIKITRGEMWFYETVEKCNPALFRRIGEFVDAGRWCIVGGWYIQPDCNLTGAETFAHHSAIGSAYFRDRFGVKVKTGYHVDSFGHGAYLPDFLTANGIRNYVMMRPGEHEMHLPGNDFHWKSPSGKTVRTFRISRAYCTNGPFPGALRDNLEAAIANASAALGETMCFVGVGDHGGGPARREIEFLLENQNYREGVKLVFSTPDEYFAAVAGKDAALPVVDTELQHHAIGCYSAVPRIKREVRDTEFLLSQLERTMTAEPERTRFFSPTELDGLWKKLLFCTFHDVLPGSAIASAYPELYDDLGAARSAAKSVIERVIRCKNEQLPPCENQRLIFDNVSDADYSGCIECEPWLGCEWARSEDYPVRLLDEAGNSVPVQRLPPEAGARLVHIVFPLQIPAGGRRILRILTDRNVPAAGSAAVGKNQLFSDTVKAEFSRWGTGPVCCGGFPFVREIRARVYEDPSDTWSHGLSSYAKKPCYTFRTDSNWRSRISGPLAAEQGAVFTGENGELRWNVRLYEGEKALELRLKVNWHGGRRMLKLNLRPGFPVAERIDGVVGGPCQRKCNGEEYPVNGYTALSDDAGHTLTVISRDVTSLDLQPDGTLRLTLLRSPYYAHHDPFVIPSDGDYPLTSQGELKFRIRLLFGEKYDPAAIRNELAQLAPGVFFSETTLGCPPDQHAF